MLFEKYWYREVDTIFQICHISETTRDRDMLYTPKCPQYPHYYSLPIYLCGLNWIVFELFEKKWYFMVAILDLCKLGPTNKFQCAEFRRNLLRDTLDYGEQFGTKIISVAICGGSISRMTGLLWGVASMLLQRKQAG